MDTKAIRNTCEKTVREALQEPIRLQREKPRLDGIDATYRLVGCGPDVRIRTVIRGRLRPSEIPQLAALPLEDGDDQRMLFADYVTPGVAERLRNEGIWFADAQGNVYVSIPGRILLTVMGKRPEHVAPPKGQHFSAAGAKVLHYLLKRGPRVHATYRGVRQVVGVSLDKIGKVIRELEQGGALRVRGRGDTEILDGDRVLRLWTEGFAARLLPELRIGRYTAAAPFDPEPLLKDVTAILGEPPVVGGEAAADALTGHLRAATMRLYIPEDRTGDVRRRLGLAPSEAGPIELCRLYSDDIAGENEFYGATLADPAFVYAELLADEDDRLAETALRLRQEHLTWIP